MTDELLVEIKNRVGILTLNRPDKLNSLTPTMGDAATAALKAMLTSDDVGCVLLTGAGRGFCAGGDIKRMSEGTSISSAAATLEGSIDSLRARHEFPLLLQTMPKVTIAVVNGVAAGAGMGMALACDLRICSDQARFGTAFAGIGYSGDFGITWGLTHAVGPAKAKELLFLPDLIGAEEALRVGIVNRVVPHEKLWEEALAVAERIAHGPMLSYRYMKQNVNMAVLADYRTMLEREPETQGRCRSSEDHKEGVAAFMEKRKANFRGR
ncbi:MAG: enoyl-CoA hydratase [Candidatus Lambdaproteobacteria bacterium]|nr:enoyl-CoA hydratase [Candidatus Lambdaproteobacteria bacterium]